MNGKTPKRKKQNGRHPTQKPFALMERIVLTSIEKNDLILDSFTGSSTTGLAAHRFDRRFIGIDENEDYLKLSIKRFEKLKDKGNQQTLESF